MKKLLAMLLAILLLTGCGKTDVAPAETTAAQAGPAPEPAGITNVDEFLAAIRPNAEILLGEGIFCLSDAENYGVDGEYYRWQDLGLGEYALTLEVVDGLTIRGAGKDKTQLITGCRWADVLKLDNCRNVVLADMTLGHTEMAQVCEGGVIYLQNCARVKLDGLGLFGCGTTGIYSWDCQILDVKNCEIYDCSWNAASLSDSSQVTFDGCVIHDLGKEEPVSGIFEIWSGEEITVKNCTIKDNYTYCLISTGEVWGVVFENNQFVSNRLASAAFSFGTYGYSDVRFDGNEFLENQVRVWYAEECCPAYDRNGEAVLFEELPHNEEPGVPEPVATGEQKEVAVYNADQFLAAIAPDTKILLKSKLLDLSTAKDYESQAVEEYYRWSQTHDGPEMVITGVSNFSIVAEGEDKTASTISATPRYANVLSFADCQAVTLSGFTAGHTKEASECAGGVFRFEGCDQVLVENCGMYGCGILGVYAENSRNMQILNSDIYECSYGGISMSFCEGVTMAGNAFWDLGGATYSFGSCQNVTLNGQSLDGNYYGD